MDRFRMTGLNCAESALQLLGIQASRAPHRGRVGQRFKGFHGEQQTPNFSLDLYRQRDPASRDDPKVA